MSGVGDVSYIVFPPPSIRNIIILCLIHCMQMYMDRGSSFFLGKVTALGVLCCFALFVCLTLLASFFLPSHLKTCTCTCMPAVCHSTDEHVYFPPSPQPPSLGVVSQPPPVAEKNPKQKSGANDRFKKGAAVEEEEKDGGDLFSFGAPTKATKVSSPLAGCIYMHVHVTALGVLCCFALFVCLTLLASFFLPSHLSFKNMYMYASHTLLTVLYYYIVHNLYTYIDTQPLSIILL